MNNVTHEKHEDDLEKKDEYLYHAAEVGVASFVSTHFRLRKKKKILGQKLCNCCFNSNVIVNISISSIIIIVLLFLLAFHFINVSTYKIIFASERLC